jgi:hypothetical protein
MSSKAYNCREDHKLAFAFMPAASAKISQLLAALSIQRKDWHNCWALYPLKTSGFNR